MGGRSEGVVIGTLLRAEGVVQLGAPPRHAVQGHKQENRFSHSGQFSSGGLPQRRHLSQSLPAGRPGRGTADKVGCQSALITDHAVRERLKSCSAPRTAPA